MALGQPLSGQDIENHKRQKQAAKLNNLVGVVFPNGAVRTMSVAPSVPGGYDGERRGLVIAEYINGEPQIARQYRDEGYAFLRDLCEKDGVPELYDRWLEAARAQAEGFEIRGSFDDLLPPSVHTRRKAGGTDSRVFVVGRGMVDVNELEKAEVKSGKGK